MDQVIYVENLRHTYNDVVAVDDISFFVKRGEIFGLLGPNGAGKSTTTEILVGLKKRKAGVVKVLGFDPQDSDNEFKKRIGVQLQTPALFERLKVKEMLHLFASFYPQPLKVQETLELVGLEEKQNTLSSKLSGGQLQRLSVALALISNADIIFLDEPTTGLDPQSRRGMWDVIENLQKQGKTIFLTTHYLDEAEKLCDRVAIVDYGKIIALGTPEELIRYHFAEQALEFDIPVEKRHIIENTIKGAKVEFNENTATVYTTEIVATVANLLGLKSNDFKLDSFTVRGATLEDVFLKLTGRRIRE